MMHREKEIENLASELPDRSAALQNAEEGF